MLEEPAPWEEFPYPPLSMGWRMGDGQDFWFRWFAIWDSWSEEQRAAYLALHVPPPDWRAFLLDRAR